MKGRALGLGFAVALAAIAIACGGKTPTSPGPPAGSGSGNGGASNGGAGGSSGGTTVNTPPVVKSVTLSDPRIEVGTPVTFTATVEDAETSLNDLQYTWTFPQGSGMGTGNGSVITWTPGADLTTPLDFTVTVKVTERYTSGGAQQENTATGSLAIHVNNSPKELADMSLRFLGMFVDSKVSPDKCVAEFSDSCNGKKDELADVADNRHDYEIVSSTLKHLSLSIAPDRQKATVHTYCSFLSKVITTAPRDEYCETHNCALGSLQGPVTGDCYTTNVYQNGRWWLCDSHIGPLPGTTLSDFARALFHLDRKSLP